MALTTRRVTKVWDSHPMALTTRRVTNYENTNYLFMAPSANRGTHSKVNTTPEMYPKIRDHFTGHGYRHCHSQQS